MIFSIGALLVKLIKAQLDRELAKQTPVGSTVHVKGVARGIKIDGNEYEADVLLRRTK